jgi:hypothetical protein
MLAGDWTTLTRCLQRRPADCVGAPFVNNRIDPALYSKPAVVFSAKLPRTADPCASRVATSLENDYMALGRIDYQRNANHSVFGRYLIVRCIPPSAGHNVLAFGGSSVGTEGMARRSRSVRPICSAPASSTPFDCRRINVRRQNASSGPCVGRRRLPMLESDVQLRPARSVLQHHRWDQHVRSGRQQTCNFAGR